MSTRRIPGRISDMSIAAEGIISLKIFDEDPALYNPNLIAPAVDRTGFPSQTVAVPPSTILKLMDIVTLRDEDDGPGFYAAMRGTTAAWGAGLLMESDDDTADYRVITTIDTPSVMGITRSKLPDGPVTVWDTVNTLEVELYGGSLESMSDDEALRGRRAYLVGSEIILCQAVTQLSATKWRLTGPLLRGWKGTEWATKSHLLGERFIVLEDGITRRVNDTLADLNLPRNFKGVTSGQIAQSVTPQQFTDTGASLKPWSPVDIDGLFDDDDNVVITWRRRSRLQGRNGRDFFDPPLAEADESYEIDILSDDEIEVLRTLTATSPTVTYAIADQTTDFGAAKGSNLHVNVYQISGEVGRGFPGHAILYPDGLPPGPYDLLYEDGNIIKLEDGSINLEVEH